MQLNNLNTSNFVDATTLIIEATYDTNFNADLLNSSSAFYRQTTQSIRSQVGQIHMGFSNDTLAYPRGSTDARPLPFGSKCSLFACSFGEKLSRIPGWQPYLYGWRPLLWDILDPLQDDTLPFFQNFGENYLIEANLNELQSSLRE